MEQAQKSSSHYATNSRAGQSDFLNNRALVPNDEKVKEKGAIRPMKPPVFAKNPSA
ncbi:MAG: hypothetical protein IJ816_02680 [Alloprevotella sp.]|nr:hypothetical protein [Alloprevotella sp.]